MSDHAHRGASIKGVFCFLLVVPIRLPLSERILHQFVLLG